MGVVAFLLKMWYAVTRKKQTGGKKMFERILTEEGFNKVYPILEQSFPETELRTREDQLALIENEKYHCLLYTSRCV